MDPITDTAILIRTSAGTSSGGEAETQTWTWLTLLVELVSAPTRVG